MQDFTELKVWQRSHELVIAIYQMSTRFPPEERFGLTSQLRRAAVSVPTNIAEGSKWVHRNDYARFLNIAQGSLAETQYLLMLARDLGYCTENLYDQTDRVARMLQALRSRVEARA